MMSSCRRAWPLGPIFALLITLLAFPPQLSAEIHTITRSEVELIERLETHLGLDVESLTVDDTASTVDIVTAEGTMSIQLGSLVEGSTTSTSTASVTTKDNSGTIVAVTDLDLTFDNDGDTLHYSATQVQLPGTPDEVTRTEGATLEKTLAGGVLVLPDGLTERELVELEGAQKELFTVEGLKKTDPVATLGSIHGSSLDHPIESVSQPLLVLILGIIVLALIIWDLTYALCCVFGNGGWIICNWI